jgi:hypothetical protein
MWRRGQGRGIGNVWLEMANRRAPQGCALGSRACITGRSPSDAQPPGLQPGAWEYMLELRVADPGLRIKERGGRTLSN